MKYAHKVVLVLLVISACIILALGLLYTRYRMLGTEDKRPDTTDSVQEIQDERRGAADEAQEMNDDWPMFRGQQRLLGIAEGNLPDKLILLWKFKTEGSVKSSPVIADGKVCIGSSDKNVYALDVNDGHKIWAYQTDDIVEATPCVIEGSVYVSSAGGFLYAIDAKTGSRRWTYETDGQILGAAN